MPAECALLRATAGGEAIERTDLIVPIAAEYPLGEAAKTHERLAAGHLLGKIALRVQPD
jgi:hypothetical protein